MPKYHSRGSNNLWALRPGASLHQKMVSDTFIGKRDPAQCSKGVTELKNYFHWVFLNFSDFSMQSFVSERNYDI